MLNLLVSCFLLLLFVFSLPSLLQKLFLGNVWEISIKILIRAKMISSRLQRFVFHGDATLELRCYLWDLGRAGPRTLSTHYMGEGTSIPGRLGPGPTPRCCCLYPLGLLNHQSCISEVAHSSIRGSHLPGSVTSTRMDVFSSLSDPEGRSRRDRNYRCKGVDASYLYFCPACMVRPWLHWRCVLDITSHL